MRTACGLGALHKSSPEIDDALRVLARESLTTIRARVPDIGRMANLVWGLHLGLREASAAPPPASAAGRKPRKKPAAKR